MKIKCLAAQSKPRGVFLLFLNWIPRKVAPEQRILVLIGQALVGPVALAQIGSALRGIFPIAPTAAAVQEQAGEGQASPNAGPHSWRAF